MTYQTDRRWPTLTIQLHDMSAALAAMIEAEEFDGASDGAIGCLMQLATTLTATALDVSELECVQ